MLATAAAGLGARGVQAAAEALVHACANAAAPSRINTLAVTLRSELAALIDALRGIG
jgi:hypothetical protein